MNEDDLKLFDINVEGSIISSVIFENEQFDLVAESLSAEDFYLPAHQTIFQIMGELQEAGKPMDETFILPELSKKISDGERVILEILSSNPISNVKAYLDVVKNYAQKRRLMELTFEIKKLVASEDDSSKAIVDVMDKVEAMQMGIKTVGEPRKMEHITADIRSDMDKAASGEKPPFFRTGYYNFDNKIGGFVENGLTVVAARPSMGKSSFMSSPIISAILRGEGALLYSMEVADKNALSRLISFKCQEPLSSMKMGAVKNITGFNETLEFFENSDDLFQIIDRSGLTRKQLEIDIIKRIKNNPLIKTILVDHLLQMRLDEKGHAPTELGEITKMLKRISQNFKVTVVLLSQLNRSVETRDNKRPMMSDLQGSGSIEQDADMIVFLYRQEYYREKEWDVEKDGEYHRPEVEHAEAIIGKNRDGPTGSVELGFKAITASFMNDYIPAEVVEYVDDSIDAEYSENVDSSAANEEKDGIIPTTETTGQVSMPIL